MGVSAATRLLRFNAVLAVAAALGGPAFAADLPLKLTQRGFPIVEVAINGEGPFAMVLDTGAGITTVTSRLSEELQLMRMGRMPEPINLAGGKKTVDLYTMGFVTLAGEKAPAPITIILDEPLNYIRDARGILGMNVLSRFSIDIDQPGRRLTVLDAGAKPQTGEMWSRLPIAKRWDNFLVVDATIGGIKAKAIIDTGANETILNASLAKMLNLVEGQPGVRPGTIELADAKSVEGDVSSIQVGNATWKTLEVQAAELPLFEALGFGDTPTLILGNDALKQVRLFVNYAGGEIYLTQPEDAALVGQR